MRMRGALLAMVLVLAASTAWAAAEMFEGYPVVAVLVNGKPISSDVPAIIMNGRTLLPVRAVADALGAQVGWNAETRTVTLTSLAAGGPGVTFGDGTHIVGTDIQPGTYRAVASGMCYWARLKDFTGGLGSTLANDIVAANTSAVVTIAPTDAGFESNKCGTWTKIK